MNESKTLIVLPGRQVVAAASKMRVLAAWQASGLSAREFGLGAGIAPHLLYDWRRAARRNTAEVDVPLVEVPAPLGGLRAAEIMTQRGLVRLFPAAAPTWAAQLVRELNRC